MASKVQNRAHKHMLKTTEDPNTSNQQKNDATECFKSAKRDLRKLKRNFNAEAQNTINERLHTVLSADPSKLFQSIKQNKKNSSNKISELKVGSKIYSSNAVPDGFYDSLSQLKAVDSEKLEASLSYQRFSEDFKYIKDICDKGQNIPPITVEKTTKILQKIRPNVNDFFSITALHYINGGPESIDHLCLLLNALICDISNTSCSEINTVYACILYKGHGKNKSLATPTEPYQHVLLLPSA